VVTLALLLAAVLLQPPAKGEVAQIPEPRQGDYVLRGFRFASGETLAELRMHYRTYGEPRQDAQGIVRNAVLIMHGTGGSGAQFTGSWFAGVTDCRTEPRLATDRDRRDTQRSGLEWRRVPDRAAGTENRRADVVAGRQQFPDPLP
jgi:hypothetical protein